MISEAVKLVKPRKPFTRLAAKERALVEEESLRKIFIMGLKKFQKSK
jgi:hypothetical protein